MASKRLHGALSLLDGLRRRRRRGLAGEATGEQTGNGRELGKFGLEEFMELKALQL